MDQYIGRLLDGRYEILEILGTGGMAVVYKARCHRLNRLVAIKILKDELSRDEEFRRRFHAEGEAVAMLSHPNIVQVYDVSSTDQANFIVMELVDGISLKQYMEKKGTLNWKETLHFAMQIAKGLEHAHSRGIVHRDIKPHNVMVLKNGSVKVMDFGIARVMSKSSTLTKEALGSVHYISPEQAKGGYTDNRSDIYSLSVVMYEMMTGRPPYDGESPVAVAIQHINGGAKMPSVLNPNIPGGLEQIIMKGMALEVKDRYASATEMLHDMEEFRKNPAIVFQHPEPAEGENWSRKPVYTPPRTTAERVVQRTTGTPRTRTGTESARIRSTGPVSSNSGSIRRQNTQQVTRNTGNPARTQQEAQMRRAQQRRREAEERREAERSRIATIAVVACSVVAIVAIVVFLVALFNGALLNRENDYVEVPELVGDMYSEGLLAQYKDFSVILQPQEYSNTYQRGQIMHQKPTGGERVAKGTELRLTVSMGPEPKVKIMQDLVNVTKEEADSYLKGQGFYPLFRNEPSYIIEPGSVTRTDPSKDTELEEGQTIIVWISTGPAVVLQDMPDVMGMNVESAKKLLSGLGFENVRFREVESNKPAGTIVYQSQEKNTELDITTDIFLEVSKGPAPTEATEPVTQPTQPGEEPPESTEPVTRAVTFAVPDKEESYVLSIQLNSKEVVEAQVIQPGVASFTVDLTNVGKCSFDLYIDGEFYRSQEVVFTK